MPFIKNGTCITDSLSRSKVHHVPPAVKSNLRGQIAVLAMLLLSPWTFAADAHAQSRQDESESLSAGVRAALSRAGGGKVLSAERINSGSIGMSRVKVVDPNGRLQIMIIEDSPRMQRRNSPFEPEEGRRGRFFRDDDRPQPSRGGRKPRSGDVEN